ncbi:MAG: Hsp70 family protein [Defluviitaleaceae bacterium]|nr:Hsp70 family protein [Defluviitaleaceae bacterium]
MGKGNFIGINFGTTNTAVFHLQSTDDGYGKAALGEGGGNVPFSSIVAIPKNGGPLEFGRSVKRRQEEFAQNYEIFTSMKSYLGTDKEFVVGSEKYTATDITAEFLKYVKEHILQFHEIDITEAGVAFPIGFSLEARLALRSAVERAGITIKSFVPESTAAYFANREITRGYSRVMVLDWGGGTFDISILNQEKNTVKEIAVFGEKIGGDDIDMEIAGYVHTEIVKKSGLNIPFDSMKPTERDHIMDICESAKIAISLTGEEYGINVSNYGEYGSKHVTINVELLNSLVEPIIESKVLRAIDTALERAGLTPSGIDSVIIVGGSSNLSAYETAISNLFGADKFVLPQKPQWSTAEGAALMQIIRGSFKLKDTIGIELSDGSIFPVFKANEDGVGSKIKSIVFSLVEETQNANFIFTNGGQIEERITVPTKGFIDEQIRLDAEIGEDQIAVITIYNPYTNTTHKVEMNKLTFHYDI